MPRPKKDLRTDSTVNVAPTKEHAQAAAPTTNAPSPAPLCTAHQKILSELREKYDILPAFTISATQISKRATRVLEHLQKDNGDPRSRVAFLHARPADVCKMITIAEVVKRELDSQRVDGKSGPWFQYNMMYEVPPRPKEADSIDETVLPGGVGEDSDSDEFEVMHSRSRFERAVVPEPSYRAPVSLSIFLSRESMPELKARSDVTSQSSEMTAS